MLYALSSIICNTKTIFNTKRCKGIIPLHLFFIKLYFNINCSNFNGSIYTPSLYALMLPPEISSIRAI